MAIQKMCQVNYRKKNLSRTGAVDKHSRLKPLPHYFLALWERLFVHGCSYVAEHMDVQERPAANIEY